jgi:carbonic anhydrase
MEERFTIGLKMPNNYPHFAVAAPIHCRHNRTNTVPLNMAALSSADIKVPIHFRAKDDMNNLVEMLEEDVPATSSMLSVHSPTDLISGYRRFRANAYKRQANVYRDLGGEQHPNIMIVACADSRVDPSAIFDVGPGQLFVVRNIANLIPPYNTKATIHGVSAAIEFAVTALKVKHIVVMGHGGCGGVKASLTSYNEGKAALGEFIGPWVGLLDAARDKVVESKSFNPQYALEIEGIEVSLKNLQTFPFVQKAMAEGNLELHGSWFAIHHGELHWRNNITTRFEVVPNFCMEIKKKSSIIRSTSSPLLTAKKSLLTNKVSKLAIAELETTERKAAESSNTDG